MEETLALHALITPGSAGVRQVPVFTDGNGRAGRVLLGMILSREGLTPGVALPVSTERRPGGTGDLGRRGSAGP